MEILTPDEQQMFLTQVNRLAGRQLADLRLTPEDPPASGWRHAWRRAADQAGLLGHSGDEAMPALWSAGMELTTVQVIRTLARHDAGAALMVHREAQGHCLAGELRLTDVRQPVLFVNGAAGLGRRALARWLSGREVDGEDRTELEGNWGPEALRLVWSGDWHMGLAPVWRDGDFHWWRLNAGTHTHNQHARCHAFEGLEAQTLSVRDGEGLGPVSAEQWLRLLMQEQLALLALGAGVLECARQLALDYAGQRRQGGRLIRHWPAVQQLLADMHATAEALEETLDRPRRCDRRELARLLRRRAVLGTDTSRACNQAMQVFGGIGYMRDLGLERLVREANALRVMSGSPLFLPLLAEHLEEE